MDRQTEKHIERLEDSLECVLAREKRLVHWLIKIEGSDNPCDDAEQLREWAHKALMDKEK